MTAIRKKFDLYLEPTYESFEFRLVDKERNVIAYLNRIKGTNETKWLPNKEEPFKLLSSRMNTDVYTEAKRVLVNVSQSSYKEIKELVKVSNYELSNIRIELYSLPKQRPFMQIELDL